MSSSSTHRRPQPRKTTHARVPRKTTSNARKPPRKFLGNLLSGAVGALAGPALDTIEGIGGSAWRGLRSAIGKHSGDQPPSEVSFQTPASFALIQNNPTMSQPDAAITHGTLGVKGTRVTFQQPFCDVFQPWRAATAGGTCNQYPLVANAVVGNTCIVPPSGFGTIGGFGNAFAWSLNPILMGGILSVKAELFDRFVFRELTFTFTTSTTTTQLGSLSFCIENDVGNLVASDFATMAMVIPSVRFPARVPQAALNFRYGGETLFYVASETGLFPGTVAQERQQIQGAFECSWSGPLLDPSDLSNQINQLGTIMVSGIIDFYDPIPPVVLPRDLESLLRLTRRELSIRPQPDFSHLELERLARIKRAHELAELLRPSPWALGCLSETPVSVQSEPAAAAAGPPRKAGFFFR